MRSSFEGIDFFIDEPNSLRNIHIFKKNSAKYRKKYILQNLMSSTPLRLTVFFSYNTERLSCDLTRQLDVGIGHSRVHKVVVMAGEEDAASDALGYPSLMKHKVVALGYS